MADPGRRPQTGGRSYLLGRTKSRGSSRAAYMAQAPATKHEPERICRDVPRDGAGSQISQKLSPASCTILVACGEDDDAWTVDTQIEMARRLGARIAVIEGAAHTPNEDCPEATADMLVKFWAAVDRNAEQALARPL